MTITTSVIYRHCGEIKTGGVWNNDLHRKIILNGDADAGKTKLRLRLENGNFAEDFVHPLRAQEPISFLNFQDKNLNLELLEVSSLADYELLRPLDYAYADLFCICFSVVSKSSFGSVQTKWIPEIKQYQPKQPIILMGCKIDLRSDSGESISFKKGEKMARSVGCCTYLESSALSGEGNISDFTEIVAKILSSPLPIQQENKCLLM